MLVVEQGGGGLRRVMLPDKWGTLISVLFHRRLWLMMIRYVLLVRLSEPSRHQVSKLWNEYSVRSQDRDLTIA